MASCERRIDVPRMVPDDAGFETTPVQKKVAPFEVVADRYDAVGARVTLPVPPSAGKTSVSDGSIASISAAVNDVLAQVVEPRKLPWPGKACANSGRPS